jgi:hypothetical protein
MTNAVGQSMLSHPGQLEEIPVVAGGDLTYAIVETVIIVALPILLPLIPPILEIGVRIISSPVILLKDLIALNYTIYKRTPSPVLISCLKANLLFFKAFIIDQFLVLTTITRPAWMIELRNIADSAYTEMLLLCIHGSSNPWPETIGRQDISFPALCSCSFDLVTLNRVDFFALSSWERPEIHLDPVEPKFAPFHIRNEYFQYKVPNMEIPPLPTGTNLIELRDSLWAIIDPTWPDDLSMNDDGVLHTKNSLKWRIFSLITDGNSIITSALGHVLQHFQDTKRIIDALPSSHEKDTKLANWHFESRSFFMSLGVTANHCIDRQVTDAIIYYTRYVMKRSISLEVLETTSLENIIFEFLKNFRQDLIHHACTNLIETNLHHVSTERYVKSTLNDELGLGLPDTSNIAALTVYALESKVDEVRELFYRLYNPQTIVRHFIQETSKLIREQGSQKFYMKIVGWFESQDPPRQAEDIFDGDTLSFKEEAILELFEKLKIIQ